MKDLMRNNKYFLGICFLLGIFVASGLSMSGYFIGRSIERFKAMDRSVSVKGFSEKIVKSDKATLTISFNRSSDDLKDAYEKLNSDQQEIINFLKTNGVEESQITINSLNTIDKNAKEYPTNNDTKSLRYTLKNSITFKSSDVNQIDSLAKNSNILLSKGIGASTYIQYHFTKFSKLRTKMIAESTKSAREAAEQFAKDSNCKVGAIKNASNGAFTIVGASSDSDYDYNSDKSFEKKIKVVSTITFTLENN